MAAAVPSMPTIGEIARRLGAPTHRVEYVIRARGIRPCGWAGNARVFDEPGIEAIATELDRIETARMFRERIEARTIDTSPHSLSHGESNSPGEIASGHQCS